MPDNAPAGEEARYIPKDDDDELMLKSKLKNVLKKRGGETAVFSRTVGRLEEELEMSQDMNAALGELVKKLWIRCRLQEKRLVSCGADASIPAACAITHVCGIDVADIPGVDEGIEHFSDVFLPTPAKARAQIDHVEETAPVDDNDAGLAHASA